MRTRKVIKELEKIKEELKVVSMRKLPKPNKTFLNIESYQVILNTGDIFEREKLVKGNRDGSAAVILPITEDNKTLVVVQPRVFKEDPISIELPAGYIDEGEKPIDAAIRELKEETGYVAKEMIELKSYYQDQGISSAKNTCFLALGCTKEFDQDLDKDEYIKYLECTFNDLVYLLDNNYIDDGNTIIAINEARKVLKKLK